MTDRPEAGEGSSIWDRLRRRKVVQWGLAYAAGAWGLLQGLQFLTEAFDWSSRVLKLGTVAALLGLPLAFALAWFRGERGHQRTTRTELAVVTLLFLIGGGIFWNYQRTHVSSESPHGAQPAGVPAPSTALPTDRSIAVLPFVNMSADQEQEYFADGISEELLNLLAQIPELRVIARTSSFSFKGKEVDIAEIARQLNVAHVLEGSVRKSGDKLRITAQLIRTADSSQLWSETYDRQLTDVFAIQDEIAAAVVDQLKLKLLGGAPTSHSTNPEAYALYLQAREINRQYTTEAFSQATDLYRQALAIDPGYAAAWAGLAYVHLDQVINSITPAEEGIPLARDAIEHALAVDPDFARAHAARGLAAILYDRDLAAAARSIERALAIEPTSPEILNIAAILARRLARFDLAIAIGEHQVSRDPLNTDSRFDLAVAHRYAGHLDDALEHVHAVLRLRPGFLYAHATIGGILLQQGDAKAALAEFRQEEGSGGLEGLAMAYHALGQHAESDAVLAELKRAHAGTAAHAVASVLAFRGESDAAFEWLERAAADRHPHFGSTIIYPAFARLHSDPRWLPFLRKHGMAPEQLAAIKFDVKLPD